MVGSSAISQASELTAFVREVVLPGLDPSPVINQTKCRFRLKHAPSKIHRWGIFADEDVPARRRVIEYTGQKIDEQEVCRRSIRQHLYVFWLNEKWALDGAFGGSGAEFINHSCTPNLYTTITRGRIYLCSSRRIVSGEELTLDYNLENSGQQIPCSCGAESCKGSIDQ
jgi:uncharacterized protein